MNNDKPQNAAVKKIDMFDNEITLHLLKLLFS